MPQAAQNQATRQIVSGDSAVLARRYAGALYSLADERKQLDAVASDLEALRQLWHGDAAFRMMATQPRLARAKLVKAVQNMASAAKLNELTGNFMALAAQNRRLGLLGAIIDAFLAMLASARGEFTADVRTARALSAEQKDRLANQLRLIAGGKVHLSVREDAGLIGGMTVKLGARLIDASVKNRLERLARQLKNPVVKTGAV